MALSSAVVRHQVPRSASTTLKQTTSRGAAAEAIARKPDKTKGQDAEQLRKMELDLACTA